MSSSVHPVEGAEAADSDCDREQSAQLPLAGSVSKCLANIASSCSAASSGIQWLTPSSTSNVYGPATNRGVSAAPWGPIAVSPSLHTYRVGTVIMARNARGLENTIARYQLLSLIHISEPTRRTPISYAVFCLK